MTGSKKRDAPGPLPADIHAVCDLVLARNGLRMISNRFVLQVPEASGHSEILKMLKSGAMSLDSGILLLVNREVWLIVSESVHCDSREGRTRRSGFCAVFVGRMEITS